MEIGRDLIDGDKPVIVFDCSDHRAFPDHPNLIMFKASYERCYETKCKLYGYPVWSGDLLKVHCNSKLKPLPRTDKPKVGFVGLGANMVRSRSIRNLREDNRIEDDIIVRKQFFNGANNYDSKLQSRKEFVDNILRNQYTLAPRGSGNFSFRFYEAMCLGRIPILIDSSCVLPYPGIDEIERYIPVCRRNSINDVVDRVVEYHRNNNIEENQKVCRDLWEKYFSPHGFYRNMVGYLSNHIS